MSKITLNSVTNILGNPTSATTTINANNNTIQAAFDNTLSRDGTSPNTMGSNLDMNGHRVLNLPAPIASTDPVRLEDIQTGGVVNAIPAGGTTGQSLQKTSNTDYAVGWGNSVSSVGLGMPGDFSITGSPVTSSGTLNVGWTNTPTGTGSIVRATSPTIATPTISAPTFSGTIKTALTASQAVQTDASSNLTTIANTGSGSNVLATSPTISAPTLSGTITTPLTASQTVVTNGSSQLSTVGTTGSGNYVLATSPAITSPTLITPVLGTPSSGTLTSCTGLPISTGVSGLGTGVATFLATPSSANLNSALTTKTGTGNAVFATSPTLTTPILSGVSLSAGQYPGTTTNDNATTGNVGEVITSAIVSASAISLTSATTANVTSISLTAGDWDVSANVAFLTAASTNVVTVISGMSTTSGTLVQTDASFFNAVVFQSAGVVPGATALSAPIPTIRVSLSTTTTLYLLAFANFTVSTCKAYGTVTARRAR